MVIIVNHLKTYQKHNSSSGSVSNVWDLNILAISVRTWPREICSREYNLTLSTPYQKVYSHFEKNGRILPKYVKLNFFFKSSGTFPRIKNKTFLV